MLLPALSLPAQVGSACTFDMLLKCVGSVLMLLLLLLLLPGVLLLAALLTAAQAAAGGPAEPGEAAAAFPAAVGEAQGMSLELWVVVPGVLSDSYGPEFHCSHLLGLIQLAAALLGCQLPLAVDARGANPAATTEPIELHWTL